MNQEYTIPSDIKTRLDFVEKISVSDNFMIASAIGLKKEINEDVLGYYINNYATRICISDGHWGEEASSIIAKHWLNKELKFPISSAEAKKETSKIETELYNKFGKVDMDENKDLTPEASFIVAEISKDNISIISYGDSRLLIVNNSKITFDQECKNSWLGAFSYLGLRGRLPVETGTVFNTIKLVRGDSIVLFTDGIDQCVYEEDTISFERIAELSNDKNIENAFEKLFKEVFSYGAEDNASLVIFRNM